MTLPTTHTYPSLRISGEKAGRRSERGAHVHPSRMVRTANFRRSAMIFPLPGREPLPEGAGKKNGVLYGGEFRAGRGTCSCRRGGLLLLVPDKNETNHHQPQPDDKDVGRDQRPGEHRCKAVYGDDGQTGDDHQQPEESSEIHG
jgi:hypothetical protein